MSETAGPTDHMVQVSVEKVLTQFEVRRLLNDEGWHGRWDVVRETNSDPIAGITARTLYNAGYVVVKVARPIEDRCGQCGAAVDLIDGRWRNATDTPCPYSLTHSHMPDHTPLALEDKPCGHAWIEAVRAAGVEDVPERVRVCPSCRAREARIGGSWVPYPFPEEASSDE